MTLIHHVRDVSAPVGLPLKKTNLVKDTKDLIWINGTHGQIVVSVASIVEVETAKHVLRQKPRNDLLNVLRGIMVSGVNQHLGLRASRAGEHQRHSPVGYVRVIKGRFEGLILDQHSLIRRQPLMCFF